jgi:uncharacterized membrane protein
VLGIAVFIGCFWLVNHWFWGHYQIIDTPEYARYGRAIRAGQTPYRDFAVEYPPGALPAFVLPTFFPGYASGFAVLMALCGAGCVALVATIRPTLLAVGFVAVSPLLIGSLVLSRFDFWPTLLVIAAVAAFVRDRHNLGWAALGAAFAVKLFPAVLVPLAIVWTLARRGRSALAKGLAVAFVVVAAAFVPFLVMAPHGLWESLHDQGSRPLQIETLAAAFLMTFSHPDVINSYGSFNAAGHGNLATLSVVIQVAALVAIWMAFARGPMNADRFVRYATAAICAFIVLGKVLSPQYLVWLIPLVPLVRGRRGLAALSLFTAALIATQIYFPDRYFPYVYTRHVAWVVLLRDMLLLALLLTLTLPARARLRSS